MLLNSFFTLKNQQVVERDDKMVITSQVTIQKSHPIFKGHFPQQPVVPGVCMIQIIKELLENHLGKSLFFTSAGTIKFLTVINPDVNNELQAEISYSTLSTQYDVDARLYWGELTFFKVRGIFSSTLS